MGDAYNTQQTWYIHTVSHLLKDGNLLWQSPAHLPNVDSIVGCLVESLPVRDGHLCHVHAHQDPLQQRQHDHNL